MILKALILVGGFGTRLRPLTLSVPKPIVEFGNQPMIMHQIRALKAVGVSEVVLAVNYKPELMSACLQKYEEELGIKISYSQEMSPMGTAGPLALARDKLEDADLFFVLNSDIICEFPFQSLIEFHKAHGAEGTIMVTKVEEPSKYGVVVSDAKGKIERFVEKPKEYVGNMINAGLYLFSRGILNRIELRPTSIEKETFPAMAADNVLYCMELPGFWMDVGQPPDYISGTALYLQHLAKVAPQELATGDAFVGPVMVHPTAKVGENCVIGPHVIIGPNCVIEDGVRMQKTTVLEGSVIRSHAYIKQSIVGWQCQVGRWSRLENVTVLGQDVQVADEVYINGGRILPHKSIGESIPEPKIVM